MTEHEEHHQEIETKILNLFKEYEFHAHCAVEILESVLIGIKLFIDEYKKKKELTS